MYMLYTYFLANRNCLPELSSAQTVKLRHLTIVSLASQSKVVILMSLILVMIQVSAMMQNYAKALVQLHLSLYNCTALMVPYQTGIYYCSNK